MKYTNDNQNDPRKVPVSCDSSTDAGMHNK